MMTQKNELDFDRHINMTIPEFIDALGRVADKLQNLKDFFPEAKSKNKYKLDKKIESLMWILMKTCLPKLQSEPIEKAIIKIYEDEAKLIKKTKYKISDKKY